jgi:hypothetical protein
MQWPSFENFKKDPSSDIVGDVVRKLTDSALVQSAANAEELSKRKAEEAKRRKDEDRKARALYPSLLPKD